MKKALRYGIEYGIVLWMATGLAVAQPFCAMEAMIEAQRWGFLGERDKVQAALEEALGCDRCHDAAYFKYGQWYAAQQQYAQALEATEKALACAPYNRAYHEQAVQYGAEQGDMVYVLSAYARFFAHVPAALPDYAAGWLTACVAQGAVAEAWEVVEKLAAQQGYTSEVAQWQVDLCMAAQPTSADCAIDALRRRAAAFPQPKWIIAYAEALPLAARMVALETAWARAPSPILGLYLGQQYAMLRDTIRATAILLPSLRTRSIPLEDKIATLRAIAAQPTTPATWVSDLTQVLAIEYGEVPAIALLAADMAWEAAEWDEALRGYAQAQRVGNNALFVWERLVALAYQRQEAALERAQAALTYYPYQFIFHFYAGQSYAATQQYALAEAAYEQALVLEGSTLALYEAYAATLTALGKLPQAKQVKDEFITPLTAP